MGKCEIVRVDAIRFERDTGDVSKAVFDIIEPKAITANSPKAIATGKNGIRLGCFTSAKHSWRSVFDPDTKIIFVGKIVETQPDGTTIYHEGKFDFDEMYKGNLVKINKLD